MKVLRLAALGGALLYFFDRRQGAERRRRLLDRARGLIGRRQTRMGSFGEGRVPATQRSVGYDDQTLKAKVESEVFRDADAPKGDVNVNVEQGVVYLRGELGEQSLIEDLTQRVQSVDGVNRVENLLHTPST